MAIALTEGHVSRALDFYNKSNKYFIIGGSKPWTHEPSPDLPDIEDYKLIDIIGLKRVDNTYLVIPHEGEELEGRIYVEYKDQKWRKVEAPINTAVDIGGIPQGSTSVPVVSTEGLRIGDKIRVNRLYEGTITSISGNILTIDNQAPEVIPEGSLVQAGAYPENAKYVYVECYLEYDKFPLVNYRQIGLCTDVVVPDRVVDKNILKDAIYNDGVSEYDSIGILEILDNRAPIPRDINMRERISMILEF